mmetsp:Transcript_44123/g.134372  ORF Transcript_44123/g.134372 Transcript_44123/m.134372 type:complete len:219 (-) Transcript_44123:277-933(-)
MVVDRKVTVLLLSSTMQESYVPLQCRQDLYRQTYPLIHQFRVLQYLDLIPYLPSKTSLEEKNEPSQERVKEEHRVNCKESSFPPYVLPNKYSRSPCCPDKTDCHPNQIDPNHPKPRLLQQEDKEGREHHGKYTVTKDAHRLEKGDCPTQHLAVGRNNGGPYPDGNEYCSEDSRRLVGGGTKGKCDRQGKANNEGPPQVPFPQLVNYLSLILSRLYLFC